MKITNPAMYLRWDGWYMGGWYMGGWYIVPILFLGTIDVTNQFTMLYTAVRRQNTLTLSMEVVEETDFSDTAYNSAYVSDVHSLIAKTTFVTIFLVLIVYFLIHTFLCEIE